MGKYIAGTLLRLPQRPAIFSREWFESNYWNVEQEEAALATGAISLQPGEISLKEQARLEAEARAAAEAEAARLASKPKAEQAVAVEAPPIAPPAVAEVVNAEASDDAPLSEDKE